MCAGLLVAFAARAEDRPAFLHDAPTQAKAQEPLQIEGSLVKAPDVRKVLVRFRGPGEDYQEAELELQYGDLYRGNIPAKKLVPPGVEYYVLGITRDGDEVPLFASPQKPTRVFVLGEVRAQDKRKGDEEKDKPPVVVEDDTGTEADTEEPPPRRTERRKDTRRDEPAKTETEDTSSELEDELALYSAVDTVALATRHEEKVQKVPAIASSYDRQQIKALGAHSVYDVLDYIPGLTISRDVQGYYRTAVRGLRSDPEVLFLLNGHPLNNVFDGRALANLPIENIERIEVIRGPGSALYGTGAFLGVVNIVTESDEEDLHAAASAGAYDAYSAHAGVTKKMGAATIQGDADFLTQSGYKKNILQDALATETLNLQLRSASDPVGTTHDKRLFVNVGAGAKFDLGGAGQLGLSARYMNEQRTALIGLFDTVSPDSLLGSQVILADLTWRKALGEKTSLQARAYFDDQRMDRRFQLVPDGFKDGALEFTNGLVERTRLGTQTFGVDASADVQLLESNRLSVGVAVQQARLSSYAYETNFLLDDNGNITQYTDADFQRPREDFLYPQELGKGAAASRLIAGLYAQDQWTLVDRLTVTFGFRVDATELPQVDADRQIVGKTFVPSFNPRAALVWTVSDPLVLKLLYGRALRTPTIQELAEFIPSTDFNQGRFEGNPDLDPATVDTLEAGADLVQAAGEARVRLRGNLFYENFSNPIAAVDDSGNVVPLRNRTLGVRVVGAEGEARLEASDRANTWVNVSWFRAMDLQSELPYLTDVPQLRMNAGISMPVGKWLNFDVTMRIGVERRNNSRSVLEYQRRYRLPTYTLVGAQLRTQKLFDHVELALSGSNLLNVDYADDAPRPDRMPGMIPREGLSGFLTLRVTD